MGEIVNLMSVDVQKIHDASIDVHEFWALFMWIGLAMYFLWDTVGSASMAGLVVLAIIAPINGLVLANNYAKLQVWSYLVFSVSTVNKMFNKIINFIA